MDLPILDFYVNGIILNELWFLASFTQICVLRDSSMLLHMQVVCVFLLLVVIFLLWIEYTLFIHSPAEEHLSCFQFLVIMNKVSVKICIVFFFLNTTVC